MSSTNANIRDRLLRVDEGGHEHTYFLPVTEGEWEHVVRLFLSDEPAAHSEALDILQAMWESRLADASSLTDRDTRVDAGEGSEDEVARELDRARASGGGEARKEQHQAFVRRALSKKRKGKRPFRRKRAV